MPSLARTSRCGSFLRGRAAWLAALLCFVSAGSGFAQDVGAERSAALLQDSLVQAIATAEKSVVAISCVRQANREDSFRLEGRIDPAGRLAIPRPAPKPGDSDFFPNQYGTGIVVDRRGLILTHYDLLKEDCDYYVTTADHRVYQATFKAADPRSELAVLEIDAAGLVAAKLGDGGALRKGQIVVALGNPYAIARDGQASASWGIVANLSRKAGPSKDESTGQPRSTLSNLGTLVQTDAKLNLGTSGGALVNLQGELVGVTISHAAAVGYEQSAGYAIPVDETFRRVLTALMQGREVEYGFLGIGPVDLDPSQQLRGEHGSRVSEVKEGTPAHRFGLQPGDVITHVDEQAIYDKDGLMLKVGRLSPEATVKLTVGRDGRTLTKNVELAKYRVPGRRVVTAPPKTWRGLQVDYWTAAVDIQLGRREEVDFDGCIVVTAVEEGSLAWEAGLREGSVITHVGKTRISAPKEFFAAVEEKPGAVQLRQSLAAGQGAPRSKSITVAAP